MQVTVEIPDRLARRLGSAPNEIAEIIENGLRMRDWTGASALAGDVLEFLARGPAPSEIIAYHPSESATMRIRELLDRNRESTLSPAEEAELDEIALLDHLMTVIKAKAWVQAKEA
jgi:hypothetical protein